MLSKAGKEKSKILHQLIQYTTRRRARNQFAYLWGIHEMTQTYGWGYNILLYNALLSRCHEGQTKQINLEQGEIE